MNKPIFNSQICTTVEQSKKLLELGVNPETADCHYLLMDDNWSMGFGFWEQPHHHWRHIAMRYQESTVMFPLQRDSAT